LKGQSRESRRDSRSRSKLMRMWSSPQASMACIVVVGVYMCLAIAGAAATYHTYPPPMRDALAFIEAFQNPSTCTGISYVEVGMGIGGGTSKVIRRWT
jgi:hypothetical protein